MNVKSNLGEKKGAARSEAETARRRLSESERQAASLAIARRLEALYSFETARTVALYASIGGEVNTTEIARRALELHKRVVWPCVVPGTKLLEFAIGEPDGFVLGPLGTRQPRDGAERVLFQTIDCVLVPGMAFDAQCHRIGRGGGYYDATLAALGSRATKIALAFDVQILNAVPFEPHDIAMDVVVTEQRLITRADG